MIKKISILAIILGVVLGLGFFLKSISPDKTAINDDIKGEKVLFRPYSHMTGSKEAKVTLVEFGDFQCPYCAVASPAVMQIMDKYKSNLDFNFVYRHFPLKQHSNAMEASMAAEAAAAQNKFLEMTELLYKNQSDWSGTVNPASRFESYAQTLGLDLNKFKEDLDANKYINEITQDYKDGEALGVAGTPTFFVNDELITDYTKLDAKLSSLLGAE